MIKSLFQSNNLHNSESEVPLVEHRGRCSYQSVKARRRKALYLVPLFLMTLVAGLYFHLSSTFYMGKRSPHGPYELQKRLRKEPYFQEFQETLVEQAGLNVNISKSDNLYSNRTPELWKEAKLFNLNFTWVKNSEEICIVDLEEERQIILVLVHTARSHFEERMVIRESWGSVSLYQTFDIWYVFLLGEANPSDLSSAELKDEETKISKEHEDFGDIVIGSFIDSYRNLTYKHLMGYKWVLNFCSEATYVLKVDDDVFVDILTWLNWLKADINKLQKDRLAPVPDLYCKIWPNPKPFRKKNSKWYVSYEDWPEKYYPNFCSGWAYSLTVELIEKLYLASYDIKFNWIDDLYVTGQLIKAVKEKYDFVPEIKDTTPYVTLYPKVYKAFCENGDVKMNRKFKVVAKVDRGEFFKRDMMCMWNKVLYDNSLTNS